jgi:hypothetical protein
MVLIPVRGANKDTADEKTDAGGERIVPVHPRWIPASTRAGSCRSHSRGILGIGRHYLALTPVVRVVVAMEPAVIGPCVGVGVERGIRVSRLVTGSS